MSRAGSISSNPNGIEGAVTSLLRTTKALLESLTSWSERDVDANYIYEINQDLAKQFDLVKELFEHAGIEMSTLKWITPQLSDLIENTMTEEPSAKTLNAHLPSIREVIVKLLQGLKEKQTIKRERDRVKQQSNRSDSSTQSWNREVPLAALNRASTSGSSGGGGTSQHTWTGGMPYPSVPTNDLSSRIMPRAGSMSSSNNNSRSYSPGQQLSPNPQYQQLPMPTHSTSSGRSGGIGYTPPPPTIPLSRPEPRFDETETNTKQALAALKEQDNLARRSSVRRASVYRGGGSNSRNKYHGSTEQVPPVPNLPLPQQHYYDQYQQPHQPQQQQYQQKQQQQQYTNSNYYPTNGPMHTEATRLNAVPEASATEKEENKGKLTLFLQIDKEVKKVMYQGEISIPALNMLFLEKFSYSSGQNDFPKIYIREPTVGISYELVDLNEVKDKSVLSFNIDEKEKEAAVQKDLLSGLSAVFNKELADTHRLFTEQIQKLKTDMNESSEKQSKLTEENIKLVLEAQQKLIVIKTEEEKPVEPVTSPKLEQAQVQQQQQQAASVDKKMIESQRSEIQTLHRDIAVLRQLEREMREGTTTVINEIKQKAEAVKKEEAEKSSQLLNTNTSVARAQLEQGKTSLLDKSDKVTTRLEDLQDTIDQLKLDVTQRKCRPSEIQMSHCAAERKALTQEIEDFDLYIKKVKPTWKKTWEQELQTIVKEQQTLKDQEYLLTDMKDDLEALLEVFEQLEKIYAYQASTRPQPREFRVPQAEEGSEGMSSVFKQVSTIDVDHGRRLKAVEQSEKMRQRELANRIDDFEKELVGFVGERKLKKTGGAMEIDRLRKQKDEEMLKASFAEKKKKELALAASSPVLTDEEQPDWGAATFE